MAHSHSSPGLDTAVSTKVLYFTDRSLTPFLINIPKRWVYKHFMVAWYSAVCCFTGAFFIFLSKLLVGFRFTVAAYGCLGWFIQSITSVWIYVCFQAGRGDTARLQGSCRQTRQFQIPLQGPWPRVWHSERGGRRGSKITAPISLHIGLQLAKVKRQL